MSLKSKDLDIIEKMIDRSNSDLAVAMARTFESLEAKVDAVGKTLHMELIALAEKMTISKGNKTSKDNDTSQRKEAGGR